MRRLELRTSSLSEKRSNQLSYTPDMSIFAPTQSESECSEAKQAVNQRTQSAPRESSRQKAAAMQWQNQRQCSTIDKMLQILRTLIPQDSGLRKLYYSVASQVAALRFGNPSDQLRVIAVTGTSGKSTTVEMIHHIIQSAGIMCGSISTVQINIGEAAYPNKTLRTTLRPWTTQKLIRKMVQKGCKILVIEVSSHAIDQDRIKNVNIDTAVLTNIYDNEHLDYHGTFAEYVRVKSQLFRMTNSAQRKPGIEKMSILNRDDPRFEIFDQINSDKKWTFSLKKTSDYKAENIGYQHGQLRFTLRLPNNQAQITVPLTGVHNLQNVLCASAVALSHGVRIEQIQACLEDFPGVPGRLQYIEAGQDFPVIVDFSYKPSALQSVLSMLAQLTTGKLMVVWGGAGGRSVENLQASAKIIQNFAQEFILTTDDPYDQNPKEIAAAIKEVVTRDEGQGFFEIEDRYEAIRYAVACAEPEDCVLIAGRGHEGTQTIGDKVIEFDDRVVANEIITFQQKDNSV